MQPIMDHESRFLASQRARTESLRVDSRDKAQNIHEFWTALKSFLKDWSQRLDQVSSDGPAETEEEKRNAEQMLGQLESELKLLRKKCLTDVQTSEDDLSLPTPPEELPLTDLRLLHDQLVAHQAKVDQVKQRVLPKGKFLFRRYRAERMRREKLQENPPIEQTVKAAGVCFNAVTTQAPIKENALRDFSSKVIHITEDGHIEIENADNTAEVIIRESVPTVLRNICDSNIVVDAAFSGFHITDLSNTTIVFRWPILGAIHLTRCQNCQIQLKCQQLRIHESKHITCRVQVSGGAILEDSTGITFIPYGNTTALDVKDFNWLRAGVSSPNYTITEDLDNEFEREVIVSTEEVEQKKENCIRPANANENLGESATPTECSDASSGCNEEDDGDDEL